MPPEKFQSQDDESPVNPGDCVTGDEFLKMLDLGRIVDAIDNGLPAYSRHSQMRLFLGVDRTNDAEVMLWYGKTNKGGNFIRTPARDALHSPMFRRSDCPVEWGCSPQRVITEEECGSEATDAVTVEDKTAKKDSRRTRKNRRHELAKKHSVAALAKAKKLWRKKEYKNYIIPEMAFHGGIQKLFDGHVWAERTVHLHFLSGPEIREFYDRN